MKKLTFSIIVAVLIVISLIGGALYISNGHKITSKQVNNNEYKQATAETMPSTQDGQKEISEVQTIPDISAEDLSLIKQTNKIIESLPIGQPESLEEQNQEEPLVKLDDQFLSSKTDNLLTIDHIFYLEKTTLSDNIQQYQLYMTDQLGNNRIIVATIDHPTSQNIKLEVINEQSVGILNTSEAYSINLQTKKIVKLPIIEPYYEPVISWKDEDSYLYFVNILEMDDSDKKQIRTYYQWSLHEVNKNYDTTLFLSPEVPDNIYYYMPYKLILSPEKSKLLFSFAQRDHGLSERIIKHEIFLFDFQTNVLKNATLEILKEERTLLEPLIDWINDSVILVYYPKLQTAEYNTNLEIIKRLKHFNLAAIHANFNKEIQKVTYWLDKGLGEVWIYDIANDINKLLLKGYRYPLWIAKDTLVVAEMEACAQSTATFYDTDPACTPNVPGANQYSLAKVKKYYNYNLTTNKITDLPINDTYIRVILQNSHKKC